MISLNHNVFQNGGNIMIFNEVPISFGTASFLVALTLKVYVPGLRFVYVTYRREASVKFQSFSNPSIIYLYWFFLGCV